MLNGKVVEASIIDPAKHTFIGNFRSPEPPCSDPTKAYGIYLCSCGHALEMREDIRKHWYEGHMDIPQYVDIKN
jgi:hypothetical protein